MTNKESILKAVQFIESNLKSDISILDIARESSCSLYHFTRLFQSITGVSPKKYLLQRRLTESIYEIRDTKDRIADIAYSYTFGSHEVFTRNFQKTFGMSPSKIRQGETVPNHLKTIAISKDYIFQSKKARNEPPDIIEQKDKFLIGVSFFISDDNKTNDISKEWNNFLHEVSKINNKTSPLNYYQIQFWSETQDLKGMHYCLAVEVESLTDVGPQFVAKVIPKGKYLRFIHKGLSSNVRYTYRYIYSEFLPNTSYKLTQPFNFEVYGEKYVSPNSEKSESHIFIPFED